MERLETTETLVCGGAYNPPTLAHLAILNATFHYARNVNADVWLLPSGNRLDKLIPTPRALRLDYIDAMIEDAKPNGVETRVLTLELDRRVPVETSDTVDELQALYPDRSFRFVFGADSTETMEHWQGGPRLLETLPMLVAAREGKRAHPLARHAVELAVQTPNISSTMVRERMQAGKPVDDLVPPTVARLLAQNACVFTRQVAY